MKTSNVDAAYDYCLARVRQHYENFPVASFVLPRELRRPIAAIYAFARQADDVADEGVLAPEERLAHLDAYDRHLAAISRGEPVDDPVFIALGDTLRTFSLPAQPLHDLLIAFRQDVVKPRYAQFADVLGYCRYSANPVGRILLLLINQATPANVRRSDCICTALQLINFLQDLEQDYAECGRIYLPQADMARFGVDERQLKERHTDDGLRRLIQCQIVRARQLMESGRTLGTTLPGRFALQLRMMKAG
jgi:squalene synthase HpnC